MNTFEVSLELGKFLGSSNNITNYGRLGNTPPATITYSETTAEKSSCTFAVESIVVNSPNQNFIINLTTYTPRCSDTNNLPGCDSESPLTCNGNSPTCNNEANPICVDRNTNSTVLDTPTCEPSYSTFNTDNIVGNRWSIASAPDTNNHVTVCDSSVDNTNTDMKNFSSIKNLIYLMQNNKIPLENIERVNTNECQFKIKNYTCDEVNFLGTSNPQSFYLLNTSGDSINKFNSSSTSSTSGDNVITSVTFNCGGGEIPFHFNTNDSTKPKFEASIEPGAECYTNKNYGTCNENRLIFSKTEGLGLAILGEGIGTCSATDCRARTNNPIYIQTPDTQGVRYDVKVYCAEDSSPNGYHLRTAVENTSILVTEQATITEDQYTICNL